MFLRFVYKDNIIVIWDNYPFVPSVGDYVDLPRFFGKPENHHLKNREFKVVARKFYENQGIPATINLYVELYK